MCRLTETYEQVVLISSQIDRPFVKEKFCLLQEIISNIEHDFCKPVHVWRWSRLMLMCSEWNYNNVLKNEPVQCERQQHRTIYLTDALTLSLQLGNQWCGILFCYFLHSAWSNGGTVIAQQMEGLKARCLSLSKGARLFSLSHFLPWWI